MAAYQLSPSPSIAIPELSYAVWNDGFTSDEINSIVAIGDRLALESATVGSDGSVTDQIRESKTGWIGLNDETSFIYDRLGYIARQLNGQFFDFDLWGFTEDLQYTVYENNGSHYTWHLDRGGQNMSPRKLSLVMQLSDPADYEGGVLEIFDGPEPNQITKQKGLVCAFPSFMLHRVTPVTKGIRKSLVVWLTGPRFK